MKKLINRFLKEEDGVTAIEYGLIAGLIAIIIVAVLVIVGTKLNGLYFSVKTGLDNIK